jgi:hypothetical protein
MRPVSPGEWVTETIIIPVLCADDALEALIPCMEPVLLALENEKTWDEVGLVASTFISCDEL